MRRTGWVALAATVMILGTGACSSDNAEAEPPRSPINSAPTSTAPSAVDSEAQLDQYKEEMWDAYNRAARTDDTRIATRFAVYVDELEGITPPPGMEGSHSFYLAEARRAVELAEGIEDLDDPTARLSASIRARGPLQNIWTRMLEEISRA